MKSSACRFGFILCASLVVGACAADSGDDSREAQDSALARGGRAAPLSGDELAFEKYLHVDASDPWGPSHGYARYSAYVTVGGFPCPASVITEDGQVCNRVAQVASLYLERDRTFTLFYGEVVMIDQWNGMARNQKKLVGTWQVSGSTLHLGNAASMATDGVITLPDGWVGDELPGEVRLEIRATNVGPNAPFWSDYR